MNNEINKICSITQNAEEYICINEQCQKQNKKQLHCFECLTKLHRKENNNIVNHIDDFKKINAFMNEVNVKKLERITYLNIMIGQLFDFKKEKFQYIEKYQNNPKEFLDQIKNQVEKELDTFIQQLAEQIVILNKLTEYNQQNHPIIFQIYNVTKRPYFEAINDKKKALEDKVNIFIQKMDLDIHQVIIRQQQKQQQLEQQLSQLTKQPSLGSSFLVKSFVVLLLIIIGLNPLILMSDQTERKEMNEKMIEFQRFVQNVQQEIESKMQLLKEEINKSEKIEQVEQKLNQTDTPYIQFKNYFNQKLKQYNETLYSIIDDKVASKSVETQQLIKTVNQTQQKQNTFMFQIEQQMSYFRSDIKAQEKQQNFIKSQILNITENFTNTSNTIQNLKTQLLLNVKILNERTLNHEYKEKKKQQFLGKILVDVPISEFNQFTIIYDELLSKVFDRKSVAQIKQIVSEETMICIGGIKIDTPNSVLVVACDEPSEIFEFTYHWQHARKSKNGDMYWYMAYPVAFGFSPTEQIHLTLCDDLDPTDQRRLSYWFENGLDGGRRIGNQTQLINSIEYKMIMFAL